LYNFGDDNDTQYSIVLNNNNKIRKKIQRLLELLLYVSS